MTIHNGKSADSTRSEDTSFAISQTMSSPAKSTKSGSKGPIKRKTMKDLTCWFWLNKGDCRFDEDRCLFAHHHTGKVAEPPKRSTPNKPTDTIIRPAFVPSRYRSEETLVQGHDEEGEWTDIEDEPETAFSEQLVHVQDATLILSEAFLKEQRKLLSKCRRNSSSFPFS